MISGSVFNRNRGCLSVTEKQPSENPEDTEEACLYPGRIAAEETRMFMTRKKLEELLERAEARQTEVRQAEAQREGILAEESRRETGNLLRQLTEEVSELKKAATRHDETIEDMLDEWSDWRGEQADVRKTLQGYTEKEREAATAREEELLNLLMKLHDQLVILRDAADQAGDATWARQLALSAESADTALFQNGIQVFGRPGDAFQYELHEAAAAVETTDPEADMRIAEVVSCGWSDRGRLLRKAKVTVYRYHENHTI